MVNAVSVPGIRRYGLVDGWIFGWMEEKITNDQAPSTREAPSTKFQKSGERNAANAFVLELPRDTALILGILTLLTAFVTLLTAHVRLRTERWSLLKVDPSKKKSPQPVKF